MTSLWTRVQNVTYTPNKSGFFLPAVLLEIAFDMKVLSFILVLY